ncbi:bifunctional diguanylate cyclase/phosphodiesterase [Kineosporia rhizophila]|uniref:putative bifunctional diguanylate cyclase/phosphodiesterase n=1 Tax=Kineosporia TaxID=49184 RepID=UPI001E4678C5|nr:MULTISPECIES: bifunctional diguanylate cyclase/phosphodiesterase [Kineosporia]MCE0534734.1 bifunctional diguanylate cyclase/phosphodiesterase [Kineosporia rhizophila]
MPYEAFRLLLGTAMMIWGAGEVVLAVDHLDDVMGYPAPGDAISALAAPFGVYALIRAPRSSRADWPGVRLGLDALLLACGITLLCWRTGLVGAGQELTGDAVINGVIVFTDCSILGIVLMVCLRDTGCRLWPAVPGVIFHGLADLSVMLLAAGEVARPVPWQAMALWSLAWPLMAVALVRYRRSNPTADSDGTRDRQEVVAAQVTVVLTFLAVAAAMLLARSDGQDALARGSLALGGVLGLLLLARELISAYLRLRLTQRLRSQAFRDALTGLPNRRALMERIGELHLGHRPWAVLTLDLDGFKEINDRLGQGGGDRLLVAAARALREFGPAEVMVARTGADEFVVLAPGDLAAGAVLGERLRTAVGTALEGEAPGAGLSASVGVGRLLPEPDSGVRAHGDGNRIEGLAESTAALVAAKASGRASVEVYTGPVAAQRERRLRLEHRLRLAIAAGSVHTVGQPIVDLTDGRLSGFESLARWKDEELGPIPPDEFIAVAEQTGMVVALGEHLIGETLAAAARAGVFRAGLSLSVNASPIQLRAPGFVDLIRSQLGHLGIPARLVVVEITEAILVDEGDPAIGVLAELRGLGVELAIDDFGTGYSALGYLRRLPVQVLKFDKTLTQSLLSEAKTVAIVDGVIRMSHRLGIRVVMEGIENEAEAERCRAVAADRGQGWLYGRPMSWPQVAEVVAQTSEPGLRTP